MKAKQNQQTQKNQPKILHIIDHLGVGGARTLVENIIKKGENNHFLFSLRQSVNEPEFTKSEQKRVKISKYKNKYNFLVLLELKKYIKENNFDILHIHLEKSTLIAYLLKRLFKIKQEIIIHEHGGIFMDKHFYFKLLKSMEKYTKYYIAVSNKTKAKLEENANIDKSKIQIIYNFIDLDKFKPQTKQEVKKLKQKFKIKENELTLGFVGRLSYEKGCDILIESLKYLKENKNFPNFKLLIIGDGALKEELQIQVKELNLQENVKFLGFQSNPNQIMPIFDIQIVPSRSESFGISAIESQSMKIPIICSNIDGLSEIIENNKTGFLFESQNSQNLANKIEEISYNLNTKTFKNKKQFKLIDIRQTLKNAKENSKKFSFSIFSEKLEQIYKT